MEQAMRLDAEEAEEAPDDEDEEEAGGAAPVAGEAEDAADVAERFTPVYDIDYILKNNEAGTSVPFCLLCEVADVWQTDLGATPVAAMRTYMKELKEKSPDIAPHIYIRMIYMFYKYDIRPLLIRVPRWLYRKQGKRFIEYPDWAPRTIYNHLSEHCQDEWFLRQAKLQKLRLINERVFQTTLPADGGAPSRDSIYMMKELHQMEMQLHQPIVGQPKKKARIL